MKNYLDNRGDYYVSQSFPTGTFNKYNPIENYTAMLSRLKRIGDDIQATIEFLAGEEEDVTSTVESAISTLETKLQVIRDAIQYISKIKLELGGAPSDISVVDLSQGSFGNLSYSSTDKGLIMNSVKGSRYLGDKVISVYIPPPTPIQSDYELPYEIDLDPPGAYEVCSPIVLEGIPIFGPPPPNLTISGRTFTNENDGTPQFSYVQASSTFQLHTKSVVFSARITNLTDPTGVQMAMILIGSYIGGPGSGFDYINGLLIEFGTGPGTAALRDSNFNPIATGLTFNDPYNYEVQIEISPAGIMTYVDSEGNSGVYDTAIAAIEDQIHLAIGGGPAAGLGNIFEVEINGGSEEFPFPVSEDAETWCGINALPAPVIPLTYTICTPISFSPIGAGYLASGREVTVTSDGTVISNGGGLDTSARIGFSPGDTLVVSAKVVANTGSMNGTAMNIGFIEENFSGFTAFAYIYFGTGSNDGYIVTGTGQTLVYGINFNDPENYEIQIEVSQDGTFFYVDSEGNTGTIDQLSTAGADVLIPFIGLTSTDTLGDSFTVRMNAGSEEFTWTPSPSAKTWCDLTV